MTEVLPLFLAGLASLLSFGALAADLPIEVEASYERAVVEFNQGHFEPALSMLDSQVLSVQPAAAPALELKALSLKALGRDTDALKTYAELLRIAAASEKPKYYFEIGSILHKQKRYTQARPYLDAALAGEFNVGACHFFLGLIDYESHQYESAERHLLETIGSDATDLKGLANFYLGIIYYRTGYAIGAIRGMRYAADAVEPWKSSDSAEQRKSAEDVQDTARRILKQLDSARWFGNFAFLTQYDSNVSLLPDSETAPDQVSGKRTLKQVFTGGGGVMTSPARTFQLVASYRTYFNYNDNPDTKTFDFFSHIPALYVNYKPYLRLTPGLKLEGDYTFENLPGNGSQIAFHPYSFTADIGPYARYEVDPHLITELDAFYRPKTYYQDPTSGPYRRSGDGYLLRGSAEYVSSSKWLAPTGYLSYEYDNTDGNNWRYTAWGLGVTDVAKLSSINTFTLSMDLSFPSYSDAIPARSDKIFSMRAAWVHALNREFSFLTDVAYTVESSSVASLYSYSRVFADVGLAYTF